MNSSANWPPAENPQQIALVTGATGSLGPTLVAALVEHGWHVRALVRSAPPPELLPPDVELVQGDITLPADVATAVSGCDLVFHLAARLHINNPSPEMQANYERVNVDGTRHLVSAARKAGVRRLVHFSTISVYGPSAPGTVHDEDTPPAPRTLYARTKQAAEEIALEARSAAGGPLAVILRLAAVYGPHMKGNYVSLLRAIQRGLFVPVGSGCNRRTLVFETDVARAALLVAETPQAAGRIYNVSDGRIHTLQDILSSLYAAAGKTMPRWHLPAAALRGALSLAAAPFALLGRRAPVAPYLIDKLTEDVAVRAERIQHELGFTPQVDLDRGWETTASAMAGNLVLP